MTEGTSRLRARAIVGSWFAVLTIVLVAVAVVGGAAAYTAHVAPGTETEQVERTHWRADGAFQHSADVIRENPVFPVGSTLSDRSTYYAGPAPVLDGQYTLTYAGAGAEPATIDIDATLVIESTSEGTVFWSDRTSLDGTSAESVAPGESVDLGFSVNATALADRQATIQESLGGTQGEIATFVAIDATVAGSLNGQPANRSFTHRLPIAVSGETYSVGPAEAGTEPVTTTRTVRTPREYGPFWSIGGPLLFVLGVAGVGALVAGWRENAFTLSEAERDLLAFREERAEFDEWVVRARLSTAFDDRARADAESLGDVVDFAIDADTGVIENPDTGLFYAVADELVVVYEPPALARPEPPAGDDGDDGLGALLDDGLTLTDEGAADGEDGDGAPAAESDAQSDGESEAGESSAADGSESESSEK